MQVRDAIRTIKERLSIVDIVRRYADLKRNGSRWVAPCPFHQETKPSFSVNEELGTFYCFGCQASGDIFEFYGKVNGLEFRDSLEQLAQEAGVSLDRENDARTIHKQREERGKRQEMLRMYALAASHFTENLHGNKAALCRSYIEKRGLSSDIIEQFGIGWASEEWHDLDTVLQRGGFPQRLAVELGLLGKNNEGRVYDRFRGRLMFPIKSLSNQIIAFGGRIITDSKDEAKYINSADSPIYKKGEHLYGLAQARRGISARGHAMLTEGYMDVLTLHQFGYVNAVGVLGTALTPEQVKRLSGFTSNIVLLFDGDNPGRKAALRSARMFLAQGMDCKAVLMPEGEDIDSLLRQYGPAHFEKLMQSAPDGLSFCIEAVGKMAPRDGLEWVHDFLRQIALPEVLNQYLSSFATQLNLSESALRKEIASGTKAGNQPAKMLSPSPVSPAPAFELHEKQILMVAMRYPQKIASLEAMGADLQLHSPQSQKLWALVTQQGENFVYGLDEGEKVLYEQCCGNQAPPRSEEFAGRELAAIGAMLQRLDKASYKASVSAAIQGQKNGDDNDTDMVYLRALQQTLEQSK